MKTSAFSGFRLLAVTAAAALAIASCGGGGSGSSSSSSGSGGGASDPAVTIPGNANTRISGNLTKNLNDIGDIANNASAISKLLEAFGVQQPAARNDEAPTDPLEEDIEQFLTALITAGTAESLGANQVRVTYTSDQAAAICGTDLGQQAESDTAECTQFFTNLSLTITETSSEAGSLRADYKTFMLVTIDYTATSVVYTWDLNPLASAIEDITATSMTFSEKL